MGLLFGFEEVDGEERQVEELLTNLSGLFIDPYRRLSLRSATPMIDHARTGNNRYLTPSIQSADQCYRIDEKQSRCNTRSRCIEIHRKKYWVKKNDRSLNSLTFLQTFSSMSMKLVII